jgi:predicted nucleotidyltransferase
MSDENTGGVFISLPFPGEQVFRYQAADDILDLLYRHPHREFTVTQLRDVTEHGGKSVDNALKILDSLDLVEKRRDGRYTLIQINQERMRKPGDPLLEIPQKTFRKPVKAFLEQAKQREGDNLVAVILFGSVARGEADRASDIDVQVIVEDDLMKARRSLQESRQDIEGTRFDGHRYEIQLLVESMDTAKDYGEKLGEIFSQGITLYSTEKLRDVQEVVFSGKQ